MIKRVWVFDFKGGHLSIAADKPEQLSGTKEQEYIHRGVVRAAINLALGTRKMSCGMLPSSKMRIRAIDKILDEVLKDE